MKPKGRNEIKIKVLWKAQAWGKKTFVELYDNMKSPKFSEKEWIITIEDSSWIWCLYRLLTYWFNAFFFRKLCLQKNIDSIISAAYIDGPDVPAQSQM